MAAENNMTSTAGSAYPIPKLTSIGALSLHVVSPALVRRAVSRDFQQARERATYGSDSSVRPPTGQKEQRVLPRPDWVPRLSWKTGAVALGVGLLVFFSVK